MEVEGSMKRRIKEQKLSFEEKKVIYDQILKGKSIRDLKELNQISNLTIRRIIKHPKSFIPTEQDPCLSTIQAFRNRKIREVIAKYAEETNQPFTCKDAKEYLMRTYEIWLDVNSIRRILKEQLHYSFKRWSPRPLLLNNEVLNVKKILFTVKLLKLINSSTVLANVDESVISNSTKVNYSWRQREYHKTFQQSE